MASRFTYKLTELTSSDVAIAGGKGASLGELIRAGASVPYGFVIASSAFQAFLDAADQLRRVQDIVKKLDSGEITAASATNQITSHLGGAAVPAPVVEAVTDALASLGDRRVSVRSSATCEDSGASAWAGQLDTYLDIAPENVLDRIRDCWLSIFSESALAYGAHHGYGAGEFAVAVVVQEMVASEISGIAFSVHPVTQEPNILLIEACLGLGEAIVSRKVIPDQYVVERDTQSIIERATGEQKTGLFMEPGGANPA